MIDNITLDNLHIGCKASNKAEVIAMIGAEFKAKGYVNQECVHFLLEREHQVSTFLGNGITLPHLPKSATDIILKTGIEIYQFPDGVIWDRSNVMFIAIGVIAKEKEHIDVLKEIASIFSDELIANALSLICSITPCPIKYDTDRSSGPGRIFTPPPANMANNLILPVITSMVIITRETNVLLLA